MSVGLLNTLDHMRKTVNGNSCRKQRSAVGQFLTPAGIAQFMASLFKIRREDVRILDAGAGAGALFAAFVENLVLGKHRPKSIRVVAYENDNYILSYLTETMTRCEVLAKEAGVTFHGEIRSEDFIVSAIERAQDQLFTSTPELFTHVILNPPYKKINGQSYSRRKLNSAGLEVSNLYAAFVWLSIRMLEDGGELVAITPRSFCNGPYFRRFRIKLLDMMSLQRIHVFESRKKAFGDDDVLQENIIYHAVRGEKKHASVIISSSEGMDFDSAVIRSVPYDHVILPGDRDAFIRLLLSDADETVMEVMKRFSTSLGKLGLSVSTGRVVDFRAREYLRAMPDDETLPLIYPCHFENGFINWPNDSGKKPNAIVASAHTEDLMLPAGHYVLTKRFTSKEERRRVVAAVYDRHRIEAPHIGFENHLNYFHAQGKGMPVELAKGLALYLNSSLFDRYFRIFSGHTQVNVKDLSKMQYPSYEQLLKLGSHVQQQMPDQETVDDLLQKECLNNA